MAGHVPVLIVEDSLHMQSALRDLVQTLGSFQVVATASNETQATEWLERNQRGWGLAILDLILTTGSGFGVIHRCRASRPDGKIVVFSEFATPAVQDRCRQLGADASFLKSEIKSLVHYLEQVAPAAS